MRLKGIIFDMDGVVTQTATLHFKSWKAVIDPFLQQISGNNFIPFTEHDYLYYLDGISRAEGMKNFLVSREFTANKIKAHYPSLEQGITALCALKNKVLLDIIAKEKVICFPDTLEFIQIVKKLGFAIAMISSSKNCRTILTNAGVNSLFPVCVEGQIAEQMGFSPKPSPDIFLEAAARLHLYPQECAVIEDALAGVKAARDGQFGLVIALDRRQQLRQSFKELQPDFILEDLSSQTLQKTLQAEANKKIQSAFVVLNELSQKNIILFLDYDGTITPICDKPADAILSASMKTCLEQLSQQYCVVIISGRELNDLKQRVNISSLYYAGNHGFEFEGPNFSYQLAKEFIQPMQVLYQELKKALQAIEGCIIENKKFTLSIHYRLAPNSQDFISQVIDNLLNNFPNFKRCYGKKVFEIRPDIEWNKGIAALYFLEKMREKNSEVFPIYIGDDVTDEDAFLHFFRRGITIKVTEELENTKADYYLKSPKEVALFLNFLRKGKGYNVESMDN